AVGEAAGGSDFADRHVGAGEKFASFVEADAADFLGRTAAEVAAELDFEAAAGNWDLVENIFDDNILKRPLLDEAEGADDRVVIGGGGVGGLAARQPVGGDLDRLRGGAFAVHHAVEGGGGFVADAAARERNAG